MFCLFKYFSLPVLSTEWLFNTQLVSVGIQATFEMTIKP